MLWTIFVVLLILWLLGFSLHVGGGLIHLLLVVGLVVLVINLTDAGGEVHPRPGSILKQITMTRSTCLRPCDALRF